MISMLGVTAFLTLQRVCLSPKDGYEDSVLLTGAKCLMALLTCTCGQGLNENCILALRLAPRAVTMRRTPHLVRFLAAFFMRCECQFEGGTENEKDQYRRQDSNQTDTWGSRCPGDSKRSIPRIWCSSALVA